MTLDSDLRHPVDEPLDALLSLVLLLLPLLLIRVQHVPIVRIGTQLLLLQGLTQEVLVTH